MSKIIVDCAISLDGYCAGTNRGPNNPMGGVFGKIHGWMLTQKAFWDYLNIETTETDGPEGELILHTNNRTGAFIMGKRMFEEGEVSWPTNMYKTDVFVLTHEIRAPWKQEGNTTFYFINDGIESALEKAKLAAQGKDIRIFGGANVVQQFLNAGLVDELFVHIAPVFIENGIRLFDSIDPNVYTLEIMEVIPSELTTHIRYTLNKNNNTSTKL